MKSNFDFLNRYWPALAQIGATAETYVYSDPNACIYKLGMFAERLVQEILVFEHIAEPAVDNTHANRIRILKRAGLLPHEIDNTLYVLRKTRNSAVHIGTDSVDEAKTLLSLTYNLAVWFMETYGDWGYIAPEFVMPSETTHKDLESVIAEQERKIEELTKQLAVVKTAASGKTQKERARRSESVSAMMNWNEAQTRCLIDEQLRLSGWEADTQNLRYSKGTRPVKGRNIAISEWPTNSAFYKNGYADYAFFVGEKLVALMDAKKMSEDVASTIDVQVKDYAAHIKPEDIPHTVGNWNGYQVPFLFASNGRAYLEQLRTKSGIWFLDVREQENQPYPIRNWFSPSDLMEKLGQNTAAANQALAAADNSFMTDPNGLNLRDYQIKAIDKATEAIVDGKRTALLAMATGTGKTRTVLGLIYKMLESKRFRRILFLVDRVSLGEQAMDTFKDVKLKEQYDVSERLGGKTIREYAKELKSCTEEAFVRRCREDKDFLLWFDNLKGKKRGHYYSEKEDTLLETTRGYGDTEKPQDYLDSFVAYVNENKDRIEAIRIACTRPSDMTRAQLRELKLELDKENFTESSLNEAASAVSNERIVADIIAFVRRAVLKTPLVNHDDRVKMAFSKLISAHHFNKMQLDLLEKIKVYMLHESILNTETFEAPAFKMDGGFARFNKKFGGQLAEIIREINTYIYEGAA